MKRYINQVLIFSFLVLGSCLTACSDFFDQEAEQIIFADDEHLNNATDTIYSVTGILYKLQVIADRTILLGEVRGDLVDVTNTAKSDLRDISFFNVGDDNVYNKPRDYYAVINNCNYFIAHADTALKNNRNEFIFMREYAAVKAIRAWTYLQLVLNYGSVPFFTDPILTKAQSEAEYPHYDLEAICKYFINDLLPLTVLYGRDYPNYSSIRGLDSRYFWFPLNIVLGDLNLWLASSTGQTAYYREAALRYYKYISERNGENSAYSVGINLLTFDPKSSDTRLPNAEYPWGSVGDFANAGREYNQNVEMITMIPCDSVPSADNYTELPNLFNSVFENNYKVSITPSTALLDISESQAHCRVNNSGTIATYIPKGLPNHTSGDLRLYNILDDDDYVRNVTTGERIQTQFIRKYRTNIFNVRIYRRMMVYLRMAEALNGAGYPRMAFSILSTGLNSETMRDDIYPYYKADGDSLFISQFNFPASRYGLFDVTQFTRGIVIGNNYNTMGIHTRGSGWTPMNEYYQLPEDTLLTEQELNDIQKQFVDSLILNENALELAFEGTRYYDLMRYAMRQPDPGETMAKFIYNRRGEKNSAAMRSEIKKDLTNKRNWYLQWNGKIGLK